MVSQTLCWLHGERLLPIGLLVYTLQSLLSPMGPPTQLPRSCSKSLLGKKYQDAVEADEATRKKVSFANLKGNVHGLGILLL